ncbi:unnamed protein product, partial [Ascophyllum nodosum]
MSRPPIESTGLEIELTKRTDREEHHLLRLAFRWHRRGSGRSSGGWGRLNVDVLRRCGTGRRLRHFRLNCRG